MTRKHFKALADALKSNRPGENWDANKKTQWNLDAKAAGAYLQLQMATSFELTT